MYWLPPTVDGRGKPCTEVPRRISHRMRPVLASKARNMRFKSPANAMPPAVESTPVRNGARCSYFQISDIVAGKLADVPVRSRHLPEAAQSAASAAPTLDSVDDLPVHLEATLTQRH